MQVLDTQKSYCYIFYGLDIHHSRVWSGQYHDHDRNPKNQGDRHSHGHGRYQVVDSQDLPSGKPDPRSACSTLGCGLAYGTAKLIEAYPVPLPSEIYRSPNWRCSLHRQTFALAVGFALAVNFLAGLYPAYKASRLDPVEAIGE